MNPETVAPPILSLLFWYPYRIRIQTLAREGRPVERWRQYCFGAGLLTLALALIPPVDTLAQQLLLAHMVEHLLIGDGAALLLVLGVTGPLLAPLLRNPVAGRLRVFTHPVVAVVVWAVNFYAWHIPAAYQEALRHDTIHGCEHLTFLVFGIAVWMALLGPLPKPTWFGNGARLCYIIVVRLIGTVLANVLIFSGTVLYPYYRPGDLKWHISQTADQITAGGIMMVEESILTICLFGWLFLKVAKEMEERQTLLDLAQAEGVELDERRAGRAVSAGRGSELRARILARAQAAVPPQAVTGAEDAEATEPAGPAEDITQGLDVPPPPEVAHPAMT